MSQLEQEHGFVASLVLWPIRGVALLIALAIWSILGFFYWVPMLVSAIAGFSALLVYSTLARTNPAALGGRLERAIGFYVLGFSRTFAALGARQASHAAEDPPMQWGVVVLNTLWGLLFWVVLSGLLWGPALYEYVILRPQRLSELRYQESHERRATLRAYRVTLGSLSTDAGATNSSVIDELRSLLGKMETAVEEIGYLTDPDGRPVKNIVRYDKSSRMWKAGAELDEADYAQKVTEFEKLRAQFDRVKDSMQPARNKKG